MNNKHVKVGRGSVRIDSLFSNLKLGEHTFYRTKKTIYGYKGLEEDLDFVFSMLEFGELKK